MCHGLTVERSYGVWHEPMVSLMDCHMRPAAWLALPATPVTTPAVACTVDGVARITQFARFLSTAGLTMVFYMSPLGLANPTFSRSTVNRVTHACPPPPLGHFTPQPHDGASAHLATALWLVCHYSLILCTFCFLCKLTTSQHAAQVTDT